MIKLYRRKIVSGMEEIMNSWVAYAILILLVALTILALVLHIREHKSQKRKKIAPSFEKCRQNYYKLRTLFDTVVEDGNHYEMVYAYVEEYTSGRFPIYKSYAAGFDVSANELVLLRIKVDLSGHSELYHLQGTEIKSAEQKKSSSDVRIFIEDNRLFLGHIDLHIPRQIKVDTGGEIMPIEQNREAERFQKFFTTRFQKKAEYESYYW